MTTIGFASAKGAPGVTTAALAVAHSWPQERARLLLEADAAGGDLGARFGLPVDAPAPGLVTLATAARGGAYQGLSILDHTQPLSTALPVPVILSPPYVDQTATALQLLADRLFPAAARVDVLIDLGRLDPRSPSAPLARRCDLLLLVTGREAPDLEHVADRRGALAGLGRPLALVLVGSRPHGEREIAGQLHLDVAGVMPRDDHAAAILAGRVQPLRSPRRLPLFRAALQLAERLAAWSQPAAGVALEGRAAAAGR